MDEDRVAAACAIRENPRKFLTGTWVKTSLMALLFIYLGIDYCILTVTLTRPELLHLVLSVVLIMGAVYSVAFQLFSRKIVDPVSHYFQESQSVAADCENILLNIIKLMFTGPRTLVRHFAAGMIICDFLVNAYLFFVLGIPLDSIKYIFLAGLLTAAVLHPFQYLYLERKFGEILSVLYRDAMDSGIDLYTQTFRFSDIKRKMILTLSLIASASIIILITIFMKKAEDMIQWDIVFYIQVLITSAFCIGMMVLAIILTARSVAYPRMEELFVQIREGNFSVTCDRLASDELGRFSIMFNHMVRGLREREAMKSKFGRYFPPPVMEEIMNRDLNLTGERKHGTILFADICNFGVMSETLPPIEVIEILNTFFGAATKIIARHKGHVDKYIGDCVMAVFGVFSEDEDHAANALRAAVEITGHLQHVNKFNEPEIDIGIGIASGEVVAGNVGSKDRLEYTVIGDTVNVASRLEQFSKDHHTTIFFSEDTYQLAKTTFKNVRLLGNYKLKGKEREVNVYTL